MFEQIVSPRDQSQLINFVNVFLSFIALTAHPMTIQVSTNAVQYFARKLKFDPLLRVESEHLLAIQIRAVLWKCMLEFCVLGIRAKFSNFFKRSVKREF